jgi:hypothetical protein
LPGYVWPTYMHGVSTKHLEMGYFPVSCLSPSLLHQLYDYPGHYRLSSLEKHDVEQVFQFCILVLDRIRSGPNRFTVYWKKTQTDVPKAHFKQIFSRRTRCCDRSHSMRTFDSRLYWRIFHAFQINVGSGYFFLLCGNTTRTTHEPIDSSTSEEKSSNHAPTLAEFWPWYSIFAGASLDDFQTLRRCV